MKIKKYEAANMADAIKLIKQDLGPEAVVLSSRKVVKHNSFGLASKTVLEVTAAINYDKSKIVKNRDQSRKRGEGSLNQQLDDDSEQDMQPFATYSAPTAPKYFTEEDLREPILDTNSFVKSRSSQMENIEQPIIRSQRPPVLKVEPAPQPQALQKRETVELAPPVAKDQTVAALSEMIISLGLDKLPSLMTEIVDIKKQLNEIKNTKPDNAPEVNVAIDLPSSLKEFYPLMVKNGVDDVIAYRFLKGVEKRVVEPQSKAQLRGTVQQILSELIPVETDYLTTLHKKIIAFIGPTGAGKTTTIAKIAADLVLKYAQKVCIVTIDNFRIGAVEQLRYYCELVNLPLYVATSPDELLRIIKSAQEHHDYILLDTMGRSQFDTKEIRSISEFLDVSQHIKPVLVLSMSANHTEMGELFDKYSPLEPEFIIFTKLDETKCYGPLFNIPVKKKIPILFCSVGQNVPEDIEVPDGKKIAKKILQEIPSLWKES